MSTDTSDDFIPYERSRLYYRILAVRRSVPKFLTYWNLSWHSVHYNDDLDDLLEQILRKFKGEPSLPRWRHIYRDIVRLIFATR